MITTNVVTDSSVTMNENSPVVLEQGLSYDWSNVPVQTLKYKKLNMRVLWDLPEHAFSVVNKMLTYAKPEYTNTLVDFKVKELRAGDCGCALEDWHIDVVRNPNHKSKPDNHLIYTTIVGTEFMLDKLTQNVEDFSNLILPDEPNVWKAPVDSIVQFDRFNLHRGPVVEYPCKRVLIRLTQTDVF